jgi:hypothetical protein
MAGLFSSDRGDIIINGKSVRYDIDSIRSILGVCP